MCIILYIVYTIYIYYISHLTWTINGSERPIGPNASQVSWLIYNFVTIYKDFIFFKFPLFIIYLETLTLTPL